MADVREQVKEVEKIGDTARRVKRYMEQIFPVKPLQLAFVGLANECGFQTHGSRNETDVKCSKEYAQILSGLSEKAGEKGESVRAVMIMLEETINFAQGVRSSLKKLDALENNYHLALAGTGKHKEEKTKAAENKLREQKKVLNESLSQISSYRTKIVHANYNFLKILRVYTGECNTMFNATESLQ